jgi:hypothetical protein
MGSDIINQSLVDELENEAAGVTRRNRHIFLERMIEVQPKQIRDAIKYAVHQKICEMKAADDPQ